MQMNSGIILAGAQPDFVNVLRQSNAAAGEANQVRTQNALRELYQTQGPQIAAGEQGAMNALSRFDPKAALGIQGDRQGLEAGALNMDATRLGMSATQQRMDILSSEEKRAVQESAARLSAAERAAAAEKVQQGLMTGIQLHQAGDLPGLNALLQSVGEQPIQSLDQFPGVAVKYKGVLDALSSVEEFNKPDAPKFGVQDGYFYNENDPSSGAQPIPGLPQEAPKPLSPQGEFYSDQQNGFVPGSEQFKGGGTVINNSMGGGDKLFETLDKSQGDMFSTLIEEGMNIPSRMAQIDQLESYLSDANTPAGIEAAIKTFAGDIGVNTEGLDVLQAARGIISSLIPQQRPPGSGTMSDGDVKLFAQSLPRLINTKEGNVRILRALRGIAKYQASQAEIAASVANREISPKDARKALSELENPLLVFRGSGETTVGGQIDPETQSLIDRYAN